MNNSLRASIKAQIQALRGFEFEAFVSQLHLIRYGSDGFLPTRERKDEGCDGIITSTSTVIACYGPDFYKEKDFIKKADEDFGMYITKWASEYPNWTMFCNHALAPAHIKKIDDLKATDQAKELNLQTVIIKGIDQMMSFFQDEFTNKQLREIAQALGVPRELVVFDYIRDIIDDLIRNVGIVDENVKYDLEIDILEKIKLNYTKEDAKAAQDEYEELSIDGTLKKIWGILETYTPEEVNSFKMRVKTDFNNIQGNFKTKLDTLINNYVQRNSSGIDDDYTYYIKALLVYCFEQCMIGEKTKTELEKRAQR